MQGQIMLWLRQHAALLALLFVSFVIYAPSLSGDFVVDDVPSIRDNPYVHDSSHIANFFIKGISENTLIEEDTSSTYRPGYLLITLLNYSLWGNNPLGHHAFLLLLHLVNTCLVYVLIRKLISGPAMAAAVGAALFALHPAKVESVAWISGVTDTLAAFFLLGAMLAHRSFIVHPQKWQYLALSLFCFQAALWSKEVAFAFPLIVIAHDLIYSRRINRLTVALHTVLVVAYLIARSLALGATGKWNAFDFSHFPKAIDRLLGYSELLVFPAHVPFYLQPPDTVSSLWGIIGVIVIATLAAFFWRVFDINNRKVALFSLCWTTIFFWQAVLLAFYTHSYYAARFMYVPSIGMGIFLAACYAHIMSTYPKLKIPTMGVVALIVFLYGMITWKEIPAWRDDEAIYGKVARLVPESAQGFIGLGKFYFERANYIDAENNLLLALQKAKSSRERSDSLLLLGTLQGIANNYNISERYLREAVQLNPKAAEGWVGLGNLAWIKGEYYDAIANYEKAIALHPGNYEAAMNLAMAYDQIGQPDRAARIRQEAEARR